MVTFISEKHFCNFICMAYSAPLGALLTAQPNTRVVALQKFVTRLITALAIAQLSTQFCALKVGTSPLALLLTGFAWLITRVGALAMHTVVTAPLRTGRAVACTIHLTDVAAEQSSTTFGPAPHVHSALSATVACTCAKKYVTMRIGTKGESFVLVLW